MVLYDYTDTDTDTDSVPWSVQMRHPVATHNNVHNERNVRTIMSFSCAHN